jgi:hypothetical protein
MQVDHVISVLESLANGIDPTTDTELPHKLFESPDVIRALFTAASMLAPMAQSTARTTPRPSSAGRRWTEDEDAQLCREYDEGMTFTAMAGQHSRTTGAIMSRLVKLGRIDPETLAPRLRGQTLAALQ